MPTARLALPEKRLFANLSVEFIEKRLESLRAWLGMIMTPEYIDNPAVRDVRLYCRGRTPGSSLAVYHQVSVRAGIRPQQEKHCHEDI